MGDKKNSFFYDLCRLCLDKPGYTWICVNLSEDILRCTGVKVSPTENLPKKICFKCLDVISSAKQLKELALKNDMHLKSLFGDLEESEEQILETESNERISSTSNILSSVKRKKFNDDTKPVNEQESQSAALCPKIVKVNVRKDLFETLSVSSSTIKRNYSEDEPQKDTEIKFTKIKVGHNQYKFGCNICDKRFDTWKKYYLHQRFHNKSIMCPLDACGKKFATKGDLEKHIRTHTGEKPFHCNICMKNFSQRGSLKCHMDQFHAGRDIK